MKHNTLILTIVTLLFINIAHVLAQSWQTTNGPYRANVTDFSIGRVGSTTTLYSAVGTGVYKTTDAGSTWNATTSVSGTPLVILCRPDTPSVLLAAMENYLKRSTNSGSSWNAPINDDGDFHPKSLGTSKNNSSYMYVGTVKESLFASMRKSSTGGSSWNPVNYFYSDVQTNVTAIAPHQGNYLLVWAGGTTVTNPAPEMYSKFTLGSSVTNGVFYSSNAGANWASVGLAKNVVSLAANSTASPNTIVFAATDDASNKLYKSSNATSGGATWTVVTSYGGGLISNIFIDQNDNVYVAATDGIYSSTNSGTDWTLLGCNGMYDPTNMTNVAIDPGSASTIYAGSQTTIFKSTNTGTSWSEEATGITGMKTSSVAACGTRTLALSPDYSVVEKNSGSGWVSMGLGSAGCDQDFRGTKIAFKGTTNTYAFASGYQYEGGATTASLYRDRSLLGGNYWEEKYNGTNTAGKLNGVLVDPKDNTRIYIWGKEIVSSGDHKNFAASIDTGTTWEKVALNTGSAEVSDIVYDTTGSAGAGYTKYLYASISSSDNGVWKSTNGGSSWSELSSTSGNNYRALGMNRNTGGIVYAAKIPSGLYSTPTNSISWTQIRTDTVMKVLAHPSYPNLEGYIWVIGNNGNNVYKTSNTGSTWTDVTTMGGVTLPTPIYDMSTDPTNNALIYVATAAGVYKIDPAPEKTLGVAVTTTTVAGTLVPYITWDANKENDLRSSNTRYAVYKYYRLWDSEIFDFGAPTTATLVAQTDTTFFKDIHEVICEECTGVDSKMAGYFIKAFDLANNHSISSDSVEQTVIYGDDPPSDDKIALHNRMNEIPKEYELEQNYPNPFNPTTLINYGLPVDATVLLTIYNVMGQEVATLVNEAETAGYKQVEFNASNLSSGLYFYRLTANGKDKSFIQVRKMLLVK